MIKVPKKRMLYMVEDVKRNRIPIFVGTIDEVCMFLGRSRTSVLSNIAHFKKRGLEASVVSIGTADEVDHAEL